MDAVSPLAACAIGDWLFAVPRQVMTQGLTAFNGYLLRSAATYPATMTNYANIYSDGTKLYGVATSTGVRVEGVLSGTLEQGELLTQEISGATGRLVRAGVSDFVLVLISGTFDSANAITGAEGSIAVTGATTQANQQFLLASSDGFKPLVAVRELRGSNVTPLARSFCKAGDHLLYFDYSTQPSVYASTDGWTWDELFQVEDVGVARPITHFHGAVYLPNRQRLLVMTGDDSRSEAAGGHTMASILVCDDVDDLVENPETWKSRWALDVAGDDRYYALIDSPYCLGVGSQAFRTVDILSDEDEQFVYWIPDQSSSDYGFLGEVAPVNYLWRARMEDMTIQRLGERLVGVGWYGARLGRFIAISTTSATSGGSYLPGCDEYQRMYAVDGDSAVEVRAWRRSDYESPTSSTFHNINVMAAKGRIWLWSGINLWDSRRWHNGCVGVVGWGYEPQNEPIHFIRGVRNLAPNGRLLEADVSKYVGSNAVVTRDTDVFDDGRGHLASLKVMPDGVPNKVCQGYLVIPPSVRRALAGNYLTLSCRALVPEGTPAFQTPAIRIQGSPGADITTYLGATGAWESVLCTIFVPTSAVLTSLLIRLYANWAATNTGTHPVYFSDIRLNIGASPLAPNSPSSDIDLTAV